MKKLFIFILLASFSMAGSAQDDDVYFVPSKKKSKTVKVDTDDDPYAEGVGRRIGDFPDPLGGAPLENEICYRCLGAGGAAKSNCPRRANGRCH